MKTLFLISAVLLAWLIWSSDSHSERTASGCPQFEQAAIWLPESRQGDLATLLNAADVLNNRMGACVIGGGWGEQTGMYFLSVREPGKAPENRRYHLEDLQKLADLGAR